MLQHYFNFLSDLRTLISLGFITVLSLILCVSESGSIYYLIILPFWLGLMYLCKPKSDSNIDPLLKKVIDTSTALADGNLEVRITNIDNHSPYAKLAWNINSAVDQIEASLREMQACFKAANENRFYRKSLQTGLKKGFHQIKLPI